jgi:hypothetical protein
MAMASPAGWWWLLVIGGDLFKWSQDSHTELP